MSIALERERLPELLDELRKHDFEIPEAYEKGWVDRLREMPLLKVRRNIRHESLDADLFLVETKFLSEVMSRRSWLDADGAELWVVSPEDLILFKLLADRPRDWGDIADVFFIQGTLDQQYMRRWANSLGVREKLEKAISEYDIESS